MKQLYDALKQNVDIRTNLIELRQQLKEADKKKEFISLLTSQGDVLTSLLQNEDAKVRKNVALVLGEIQAQEFFEVLFESYEQEETLFVRSAYLKAMQQMDYSSYTNRLKERLSQMLAQEVTEENKKHYREELSCLQKMLLKDEKTRVHKFKGLQEEYHVLLTTNRQYREITARQVRGKKITLVPLGVKVQGANLKQLFQIRTFHELLFVLDVTGVASEPQQAAQTLAESNLMALLQKAYGTEEPFYFRITIVGKMSLEKRSDFIKKCSFELEQFMGRKMINSASDYECEIKLLERADGTFAPFVKLNVLKDERFAYRRESIATSIKPPAAALIATLAQPYLKEGAQVLDPFCGVGTMLIERDKKTKAKVMYGIDIFGEAIRKARNNTEMISKEIYYINRDFFDFSHDYLFDEIFTNMPVRGKKSKEEQEAFYQQFFTKARQVLKKSGLMILYSNEEGFIKKQLRLQEHWKLWKEYPVDEKNGFSVYIIGQRG